MPVFISYLEKCSVSLAVVYFFYQVVLRKLTFYNCNRFYLVCGTLLSFFIPLINITRLLEKNEIFSSNIVRYIPQVGAWKGNIHAVPIKMDRAAPWTIWDWAILVIATGVLIMLIRLIGRLFSFRKMVKNAAIISNGDVRLYQVNQPIIPFSFGNAIFINQHLHTDGELREIIHHEFVHVKQKHTADILLSEIICTLNWYNPFVWLIRKAIRQNLEFIADNKVLQSGVDKTRYQYLLLKVIGNNHFSIAQQFNFSSLKKRIAMMNKMKSAETHLVKFLFMLPLLFILLVAFRNSTASRRPGRVADKLQMQPAIPDSIPVNSKGYSIELTDIKGTSTILVKDRNGQEVKRLLPTEWEKSIEYYEAKYGVLPGDQNDAITGTDLIGVESASSHKVSGAAKFKKLSIDDNLQATVTRTNGKIEKYNLNNEADKKAFEEKYGPLIGISSQSPEKERPVTITKLDVEYTPSTTVSAAGSPDKNGRNVYTTSSVNGPVQESGNVYTTSTANGPVQESGNVYTTDVAGTKGMESLTKTSSTTLTYAGNALSFVDGDILIEIKNDITEEKLVQLAAGLKNKGYELTINKTKYRDGKAVLVEGIIAEGSRRKTFTIADFSKFVISDVKDRGGKKEFNFYTGGGNLVWQ